MDNIRVAIDLFFGRINHYNIKNSLENLFNKDTKDWFCNEMAYLYPSWYNHENILHIYDLIQEWINIKGKGSYSGVFNLLYRYTSDMLIYENGQFWCREDQFLRWRKVIDILGEDILTTNYLSNMVNSVSDFTWQPHVKIHNSSLAEREYIDLHFHLNASSLNFMLNWITLMNYTKELEHECGELYAQKRRRYLDMLEPDMDLQKENYYNELIVASIIRIFLYELTKTDYNTLIGNKLFDCLEKDIKIIVENSNLKLNLLQKELEALGISYKTFDFNRIDYALDDDINNQGLKSFLSGERKILYNTFLYLKRKDTNWKKVERLLYLYVILKTKLRERLIQKKKHIGLNHFKKYNGSTKILLSEKGIYVGVNRLKYLLAINNTIDTQNLKYLEVRISPCNYKIDIVKLDKLISDNIANEPDLEVFFDKELNELIYHYIIHFHKPSKPEAIEKYKYRSQTIRNKYFKDAEKLLTFLNSYSNLSQRIVGIDAAGTEMYCRPEIFAVTYRYLKENYRAEPNHIDQQLQLIRSRLGFTYHVGEDFADITNGLRSIDEAIHFLDLQSEDRISHALALGEDVEVFYRNKNNTVILPRQDRLDDLVWLYIMNKTRFNSKKIEWLDREAKRLFEKIYIDANWDIELYYNSMLLRGDAPEYYMVANNNAKFPDYKLTHKYINKKNPDELRLNTEVRNLYHAYHFNFESKKRGSNLEEFKISVDEKDLIKKAQRKMQKLIDNKNIYIECNPTSNVIIGNTNRYSSHPILKFSNSGLKKINVKKIISSINTDDQGIFDTCIQHEYALMIIALKKEQNSKGTRLYSDNQIAAWMSTIQKNADQQRFRK